MNRAATPDDVVIRPVGNRADLLAGLEVRRAAYDPDAPALAYAARRMGRSRVARTDAWVLAHRGAVVSTLLRYLLTFSVHDRVLPGYGLGSVATRPEARGNGFATALLSAAIGSAERAGRTVGLLFSAIPPALYERLGFRTLPAWRQRCERLQDLADSGDALLLEAVNPRRETERLVRLYDAHHRGRPHLARDLARFRETVDDAHDDLFLTLPDGGGYLRVADDDASLPILEFVVLRPADELPTLRAAARLALDLKRDALTGWLPPSPAVTEWFTPLSREKSLPMVRGAEPSDAWRIWSSDYF